ncbi:nucleotidyl transferase AbiEii/AbiGii toxin family protein [Rhizobium sp. 2YAF20]|uniref:nucleotidyl transferase AbiEii/AbiGii toxin family protein n=1 Tax=Rhizobium sp. 2YAF20 TaxID=3233027 RepID=UPI003F94A534
MANDATFDIGKRTIDRIKSASSVHELDTRKSTERFLCEEISRGLSTVFPVRHLVKGGLLHAQVTRETGDLDITFARKVSEPEILQSLRLMAPLLAAKGITITRIGKIQDLIISGDGGMRFPVEADCGGTRINTHLDITGGMRHLPASKKDQSGKEVQVQKVFSSVFFKDQQPLEAYFQPFEGQAADKLSVLVLRPDATRWKDFADISHLHKMNLSPTKIAIEMSHKLSFMFETAREVLQALPEVPETMSFEYAREKAAQWQNWQAKNGRTASSIDFEDANCNVRNMYFAVRKVLVDSFVPYRRPRVRHVPTVDEVRQALNEPQARADRDNVVVHMGLYRDPATLKFRPK